MGNTLVHRQAASLIPADKSHSDFRGDTLRLSRRPSSSSSSSSPSNEASPPYLFATTRGKTTATKGFLVALSLDASGLLTSHLTSEFVDPQIHLSSESEPKSQIVEATSLWETPTSGGKANAISLAPYSISSSNGKEGSEWIVLTDDDEGYVFVVEWSESRGTFEEISRVKLGKDEKGEDVMASHAIWLA